MATVELGAKNFESTIAENDIALPTAAREQVITAVREVDIEQTRADNEQLRSAI